MPAASAEKSANAATKDDDDDADDAPQTAEDQAARQQIMIKIHDALVTALPALPPSKLVDLLEFIAVQHVASFNPDNTGKALEIAAFCKRSPFAVSRPGVAALARLARHSLGLSEGRPQSPEHQLWLLASGALNTAAAILEFDGDAVSCYEEIRANGGTRGRYMQRLFAQSAMQDHVQDPNVFKEAVPPPDLNAALRRVVANMGPLQLLLAGFLLFVAVVAGIVVVSERATIKVANAIVP